MSIPSISGDEEAVGFFLRDHLQRLGWTVELQEVKRLHDTFFTETAQ